MQAEWMANLKFTWMQDTHVDIKNVFFLAVFAKFLAQLFQRNSFLWLRSVSLLLFQLTGIRWRNTCVLYQGQVTTEPSIGQFLRFTPKTINLHNRFVKKLITIFSMKEKSFVHLSLALPTPTRTVDRCSASVDKLQVIYWRIWMNKVSCIE